MVSSKKLAKTKKTPPQMIHRNHVDTPAPRPWSKASHGAELDTFLPVSEAGRRPTQHSQESRQQQALLQKAAGRPETAPSRSEARHGVRATCTSHHL